MSEYKVPSATSCRCWNLTTGKQWLLRHPITGGLVHQCLIIVLELYTGSFFFVFNVVISVYGINWELTGFFYCSDVFVVNLLIEVGFDVLMSSWIIFHTMLL